MRIIVGCQREIYVWFKTLSVAKVSSIFDNHSVLDTSSYELSFSQWPILAPPNIVTFPPESPFIASEIEYWACVERCWQGKDHVLGQKPVLLLLWAQHIVHGGSRVLIPGPISVGFAVDEVVRRQILVRVLWFSFVNIIPSMFHTLVACRLQT